MSVRRPLTDNLPVRRDLTDSLLVRRGLTDNLSVRRPLTENLSVRRGLTDNFLATDNCPRTASREGLSDKQIASIAMNTVVSSNSFKDIFIVCDLGNELIIRTYRLHTKSVFLVIFRLP